MPLVSLAGAPPVAVSSFPCSSVSISSSFPSVERVGSGVGLVSPSVRVVSFSGVGSFEVSFSGASSEATSVPGFSTTTGAVAGFLGVGILDAFSTGTGTLGSTPFPSLFFNPKKSISTGSFSEKEALEVPEPPPVFFTTVSFPVDDLEGPAVTTVFFSAATFFVRSLEPPDLV